MDTAVSPPVILSKFAAVRTFVIGGVNKESLLNRVEMSFKVGIYAKQLVQNPTFITLENEESVDTITLTVSELGHTQSPTTNQLCNPRLLAEWSAQNSDRLPKGYDAIELLPGEAAFHIREQYKDQPLGEKLWIGMEPVHDYLGEAAMFHVNCTSIGKQGCFAEMTRPGLQWNLSSLLILRLRKVSQE